MNLLIVPGTSTVGPRYPCIAVFVLRTMYEVFVREWFTGHRERSKNLKAWFEERPSEDLRRRHGVDVCKRDQRWTNGRTGEGRNKFLHGLALFITVEFSLRMRIQKK